MKSTAPASAKTALKWPAAWRSSVKHAWTICQSSSDVACRGKTVNPMRAGPTLESPQVPQSSLNPNFSCLQPGGNTEVDITCLRKAPSAVSRVAPDTQARRASSRSSRSKNGPQGNRRVRQDPNVARRRSMRRQTSRVHEPRQLPGNLIEQCAELGYCCINCAGKG